MSNRKKPPDKFIHQEVIPVQQEDPEGAIAFYLENAQPDDPRVLKVLLDFYAADVYLLTEAILDDDWRSPPDINEISSCVDRVFTTAIDKRVDFLGQESLGYWLYSIAIRVARRHLQRRKFQQFLDFKAKARWLTLPHRDNSLVSDSANERVWDSIDKLRTSLRIAVLLHFLLDLPEDNIASILGKRLKPDDDLFSNTGFDHLIPPGDTSTKSRSRIAAALDSRWPRPELELTKIYQRIEDLLSKKGSGLYSKLIKSRFGEAIILAAVTLSILAGITILSDRDEGGGRPLFPPTPGPLPEPVMATSSKIIDLEVQTGGQDSSQGIVLFSTEPNLSKDGVYLVFTSSINAFLPGDTNGAPDIYFLNLDSNIINRVSVSSTGAEANHASYSPGISADGRYVVFSSVASNLVSDDLNTCNWYGAKISCMDIFIHDVETGLTERVSVAEDGTETDNNSYYPTISADGRWVVYWSEASNLTTESRSICGEGYRARNCTNLYIYDRINGSTKLIPIGRQLGFGDVEPVSISGNGRFLSLTILSTDQVAERLNVTNQSEVFVYDSQFKSFTPINLDRVGNAGNAESYHPRISTDGRYVAFASLADNLRPDDTNDKSDVFLYDRIDKTTHLLSMSLEGSTGNAESGTQTIPGLAGWGEQISISDDGRFVTFTSHADDLGADQADSCGHLVKSVCVNVYLHDRAKGQTKLIMPGRGLYSFYVNIKISGDGRWIAIIEQFVRCTDKDICSQLWLYDVENKRLEFPLRNQIQFPGERSNWPYLSFGQGSKVNAIAFSPDGSTIATGANDSTIKMWDINGAPLFIIFGHRLPVSDVEFSQDGSYVISSSHDGTVKVWDRQTGKIINELIKHNNAILGLALSADGSQLAAGGVGGTWFWDKNKDHFNLDGSILHPGTYVSDLAFSPDGAYLALAMSDDTVWIKDMVDQETVLRLGGHKERVLDVAFSPDGHFLASGSEDHTLNLWGITSSNDKSLNAQHIASVKHPNWVRNVNFSPDESLLASVALGDKVYLWDITQSQTLKLLLRISHDEVMSLNFSADSQTVAAGTIGGNIHLWHLSDLEMEP